MHRFGTHPLRLGALLAGLAYALPSAAAGEIGLPYTFEPDTPARAAEVNANFRYIAPENVVYVSGTAAPAANGAALLQAADVDALAEIGGPPSRTNPYLIKLRPGTYALGASTLTLNEGIHLEGAGVGVTTVTSEGPEQHGIRMMGSSIRNLTVSFQVRQDAVASDAILLGGSTSNLVSHVAVEGTGAGRQTGIRKVGGGDASIEDTTVSLDVTRSGGAFKLSSTGRVSIRNVDVHISGTGNEVLGLYEDLHRDAILDVRGMRIDIRSDRASGINRVFGIYTMGQSQKKFSHVHVRAHSPDKKMTFAMATYDTSDGILEFEHGSLLNPDTPNGSIIRVQGGDVIIRIGATKVTANTYTVGSPATPVPSTTTVKCVYVYDEAFEAKTSCYAELI